MEPLCKYSPLYRDADKNFTVNFESRNLRPISITLPTPPRLDLIDGWGLHPDDQTFKKLEIPRKLKDLENRILSRFSEKTRAVNGNTVLTAFWEEFESRQEEMKDEIEFVKKFIYFMWYGYWVFIDGKPTYIPPWYFSYLNIHRMTVENGYAYPEYRDKGRMRFLFRHLLQN